MQQASLAIPPVSANPTLPFLPPSITCAHTHHTTHLVALTKSVFDPQTTTTTTTLFCFFSLLVVSLCCLWHGDLARTFLCCPSFYSFCSFRERFSFHASQQQPKKQIIHPVLFDPFNLETQILKQLLLVHRWFPTSQETVLCVCETDIATSPDMLSYICLCVCLDGSVGVSVLSIAITLLENTRLIELGRRRGWLCHKHTHVGTTRSIDTHTHTHTHTHTQELKQYCSTRCYRRVIGSKRKEPFESWTTAASRLQTPPSNAACTPFGPKSRANDWAKGRCAPFGGTNTSSKWLSCWAYSFADNHHDGSLPTTRR